MPVKTVVQLVIALCMLAVAGGAWWYFYAQAPAASGAPQQAQGGFAVPVETARVTVGPIERRLTAVGSLRSNESVVIRPEIAGRIAEFRFDEGERVEKGQPLVRLDDTVWRAVVDQVQAALELSQANYERAVLKSYAAPVKLPADGVDRTQVSPGPPPPQ